MHAPLHEACITRGESKSADNVSKPTLILLVIDHRYAKPHRLIDDSISRLLKGQFRVWVSKNIPGMIQVYGTFHTR
jgi:hypothetical protein